MASTQPQRRLRNISSISVSQSLPLYCQSPLSTIEANKQTNNPSQLPSQLPLYLWDGIWPNLDQLDQEEVY